MELLFVESEVVVIEARCILIEVKKEKLLDVAWLTYLQIG